MLLGATFKFLRFWNDSRHDLSFPAGENDGPKWKNQFVAEDIKENTSIKSLKLIPKGAPRVPQGWPTGTPSVARVSHDASISY